MDDGVLAMFDFLSSASWYHAFVVDSYYSSKIFSVTLRLYVLWYVSCRAQASFRWANSYKTTTTTTVN